MNLSLSLYEALTAASAPPEKAKAAADAWEAEVQNLASKSDLQQTEDRLQASITEQGKDLRNLMSEEVHELRATIREQGHELRTMIKEQNHELRTMIKEQNHELRTLISEQGSELRLSIQQQGADLRLSMSGLQSQINVMRWQIGLIIVCVAIPLIKLAFDLLTR
ncbi:apolipoprotein A1/A4/E family protein [Pseudomonas vanderleydeniana]|uniref:Apolipoprotein A1/A4/E family protein n=2 Tax=Pseudomonas vanderleydeniana TaxID=2745495 RepID=A0A9E6PRK7_9PSED|nr:apolipoprotein A1/A4/E family protein [Pseudomonas vanderleydeniana]